MSTVTVAVSELTGAALDWAVAKAVGYNCGLLEQSDILICEKPNGEQLVIGRIKKPTVQDTLYAKYWRPSTDWAQLGPLVDQFDVAIIPSNYAEPHEKWSATVGAYSHYMDESLPLTWRDGGMTGPTALIAACRAIVLDKLGKTLEIPQELISCPQ